jgi:hypothetical protein
MRGMNGRSAAAALGLAWLLAGVSLAGCCADPWKKFPEGTPPDRTCSTGSIHGHDVYIWDCLRGQHVVVAQWSGENSCRMAVREVGPCGQPTKLERKLALTPAMCAGARTGRAWRSP